MYQNLNQIKKNIKVGDKIHIINHLKNTNEDRIILKTQSNSFYSGRKATQEEIENATKNNLPNYITSYNNEAYTNTWFEYPKAKNCNIKDNTLNLLAHYESMSNGNSVMIPSPDFKEGDIWLSIEFK